MGRDLSARVGARNTPATTGGDDRPAAPKPLAAQIQDMEKEFQRAMPQGLEATRLIRDAQTCLRQTPKLAECVPATVLGALMTCAQLGLRPGVLGHAYLIPFYDSKHEWTDPATGRKRTGAQKAQLILGYQGLVELVYRSDRLESIHSRVVYSNDEFKLEYRADGDELLHKPCLTGQRGEPVLYYAVARMKGGGYAFTDPMTQMDMELYRDRHAMSKRGPWVTEFEGMAKKTMVRQLVKLLPKSTEVSLAITHDGAIRMDHTAEGVNAQPDYIDGAIADDEPDAQPGDGDALLATADMIEQLEERIGDEGFTDADSRGALYTAVLGVATLDPRSTTMADLDAILTRAREGEQALNPDA